MRNRPNSGNRALVYGVRVGAQGDVAEEGVQPFLVPFQREKELRGVGQVRVPVDGLLVVALGEGLALFQILHDSIPVITAGFGRDVFFFAALPAQLGDFLRNPLGDGVLFVGRGAQLLLAGLVGRKFRVGAQLADEAAFGAMMRHQFGDQQVRVFMLRLLRTRQPLPETHCIHRGGK